MNPTAAKIAQKAGVSVRTVWTSFGDKESLYRASSQYWFERDKRLRVAIDPDLPLEERTRLFCDNRAKRLDAIAPAARATDRNIWDSVGLMGIRREYEADLRDEVSVLFAGELPDGAERRAVVMDAISTAVSWRVWSHLRDDLDRTMEQSARTMEHLLIGALRG